MTQKELDRVQWEALSKEIDEAIWKEKIKDLTPDEIDELRVEMMGVDETEIRTRGR